MELRGRARPGHRLQLDDYPLDLVEGEPVIPAIIESRCSGALMICHLLRNLKLPTVPQVLGNAGSAEGMVADFRSLRD
jgi:hypothetical protein